LLEWITGYPERSLEMAEEAVALARRIGHPFNTVFALTAGNECLAERGETGRMLEYCDEADQIIEDEALGEFALRILSNNWRGRALILRDEFEPGYALTADTNAFWKAGGGQICSGLFWSSESLGLQGLGRRQEAMQRLDQAIDYCRQSGDRWMEPELFRIKGNFLLDRDDPQPQMAERAFIQSLDLAREHAAKSWELRAATSLALLWRSQQRESAALDLVTPVYEWFTEGFGTQDLRETKSLLESLS
jgi:tetratricopeptide (TPR) repeat protein